jgi:hypothetical protein
MQLLTGLGVPYAHGAIAAARQHLAAVTAVQHILYTTAKQKHTHSMQDNITKNRFCV